ncbi:MAG: HAMP domain-containing histidine kinase, partial [Verrucomicrobiales bacterium]|nr:HAMP domain-containing histidine kinase [Verrucomicrobiales bacterium]
AGAGGDRIEQLGETLTNELRSLPDTEWVAVLDRHETQLGLTLALFGSDGTQKLGTPLDVPPEALPKLIDKRNADDMPSSKPNPGRNRDNRPPRDAPPKPRFMLRTANPTNYWAGIHLTLAYGEGAARRPLTLVVVSDSVTGRGFFFDAWPWAGLVAGGLVISALIWLPVVGGITRAIRRTNEASKRIAAGGFDVRVPDQRNDELGELATSVNTMAAQLGDYVAQQRRITADVAHELCSPIARMQMALGVVEQRGTPDQAAYLKKLDSELQHMAKLVEEVLAFSKADTLPEREVATDIEFTPFAKGIIAREAPDADIVMDVPEGLQMHTLKEALDRAIGNVLRNAARYASSAGPIHLQVSLHDKETIISITDQGPGVPPDALPRLFEPFFRPEAARARHTGGSGLGLAIVKRCIAACGGTVSARLLQPQGLEIEMRLPLT